jgi:predicted GNAT superfamily acetyltransferase
MIIRVYISSLNIVIINTYASNNRAPKYKKQNLIWFKETWENLKYVEIKQYAAKSL